MKSSNQIKDEFAYCCAKIRCATIALLLLSTSASMGQQLKTTTENIYFGRFQAKLTYQYYEKEDGSYVKHGTHKITCDDTYRDSDCNIHLKYTGSITYKNGVIDGPISIRSTVEGRTWNRYKYIWEEGSKTLTLDGAFCDNNKPDGRWVGKRVYNGFNGSKRKEPDVLDVTYNKGVVAGPFKYCYWQGETYEANGNANKDGYLLGKSVFNSIGLPSASIFICNEGWLVDMFVRESNGSIGYRADISKEAIAIAEKIHNGEITEEELFEQGYIAKKNLPYISYQHNSYGVDVKWFFDDDYWCLSQLLGFTTGVVKFNTVWYKSLEKHTYPILTNDNIEEFINKDVDGNKAQNISAKMDEENNHYYCEIDGKTYYFSSTLSSSVDTLISRYNAKVEVARKKAKEKAMNEEKSILIATLNNGLPYTKNSMWKGISGIINYSIDSVKVDELNNRFYTHAYVTLEQYSGKQKPCIMYIADFVRDSYAGTVDVSFKQFEHQITSQLKSAKTTFSNNDSQIKSHTEYKDIFKQYTEKIVTYNTVPDYSTISAQKQSLANITKAIEYQKICIQSITLYGTILSNENKIKTDITPYKNIKKAYGNISKYFNKTFTGDNATVARLNSIVEIQQLFIKGLEGDNAYKNDMALKNIKDPVEIKKILSLSANN